MFTIENLEITEKQKGVKKTTHSPVAQRQTWTTCGYIFFLFFPDMVSWCVYIIVTNFKNYGCICPEGRSEMENGNFYFANFTLQQRD